MLRKREDVCAMVLVHMSNDDGDRNLNTTCAMHSSPTNRVDRTEKSAGGYAIRLGREILSSASAKRHIKYHEHHSNQARRCGGIFGRRWSIYTMSSCLS
jgi:hypothetical protein